MGVVPQSTTSQRIVGLLGGLLVAGGLCLPDPTKKVDLSRESFKPESGHAYIVDRLPLLPSPELAGDDNGKGDQSPILLFEDGRSLGPAHTAHEDIRNTGQGRFSHWGAGLYFSASDNTDPRANGRSYAVGYVAPLPQSLRWTALILGVMLVALSQAKGMWRELGAVGTQARSARFPPAGGFRALPWAHISLFAFVVALVLYFGAERSGWVLITQPVELSHGANSLLGYSFIHGGEVFHKENYSAYLQVGFFSGFEVLPDLYFLRPVYTFLASLLAPAVGITASLLFVNLAGWAAATWLCHRFALRFYGDPRAARWAAALAVLGTGFVVHALDYSAHLLAFTFYFGGVVLIYESNVWRERVGARVHAIIAAYLALACLQYNTGIALVAGYLMVAFRHNPLRLIVPAAVAALAAQPAWGWIVVEIYRLQTGVALADLSQTEREYLGRALQGWRMIFAQPLDAMVSRLASIVGSFLTFEAPLVVLVGAAYLAVDAFRGEGGRKRAFFAVPFIVLPVAAAMVFANAAGARGYLVFGISIFFFAACGAALAALYKRSRMAFVLVAGVMIAASFVWSMAHYANVLGPSKAYFLGMSHLPMQLFVPGSWEAVSLTGAEPTPRAFGGVSDLGTAGLTSALPVTPDPLYKGIQYALFTSALLVALCGLLFALCSRAGWRVTLLLSAALLAIPTMAGRSLDGFVRVSTPENMHRVDAPLVYSIDLSGAIRDRLRAGLAEGHVVILFAAHYNGKAPTVHLRGQVVRLDRKVEAADWVVTSRKMETASWVVNSVDLRSALQDPGAIRLEIGFPGSKDAYLGGWQRVGLPGRAVEGAHKDDLPALPAVELRLLRNNERGAPVLIAF